MPFTHSPSSDHETPPTTSVQWNPSVLIATCGGIGFIRYAPGTWGTALGVAISPLTGRASLFLAAQLSGGTEPFQKTGWFSPDRLIELGFEATGIVLLNILAIFVCTHAIRFLQRGCDPGAIVLDETGSVLLGLLIVPPHLRSPTLLLAAFAIHRFFDIVKPFPCRQLESLPAGLGVMADDWAAADWMMGVLSLTHFLGWL